MQTLFLSYTYRPHPDHESELERLRKYTVRAVEAMGLRVIDGVDVGGRPLDDGLRKKIDAADALIALVTPQADNAGQVIDPAFVLSEFQYAEGRQKPTMRVIHSLLTAKGLNAGNEYTPYKPGAELEVILKLMNTIALWAREHGRVARIRIEPAQLAAQYNEESGDRCHFQVISQNGKFGDFERASLLLEPGAAYVMLPKVREGERIKLRMEKGGQKFESQYAIDPFVGGVTLEAKP